MPSIRRKGGGYEVRYYAGRDAEGRPIRRSKMVQGTLRQARAEATLLEGGIDRRDRRQVTFGDLAELWLAGGGRRTSELSQQAAEGRMRRHSIPALGHLPVADITSATLEATYRDLRAHKGLAPSTIRLVHSDISGTMKRAVRDGLVDRNPAASVELPFQVHTETAPPAPADVVLLLDALDASPGFVAAETALALRLAVATGARIGEVAGLRWGDVDTAAAAIAIVRAVIKPAGKPPAVKETKGRTRRRVAVPEALVRRLEGHGATAEAKGHPVGAVDYVLWGGAPGAPLDPDSLRARFLHRRRALGLTFRFHDLRHLAASMFLADMDVLSASAAIGHRRTSTTTDTYGHRLELGVDRRTAAAVEKRIQL